MLDHDTAEKARDHILEAIQQINKSWQLVEGEIQNATFQEMKRAAGVVIGTLDVDYLCHIFEIFPDLDEVGQMYGIDHLGREKQSG
jgi:hypothetical protein